jgi:hypothetical protein
MKRGSSCHTPLLLFCILLAGVSGRSQEATAPGGISLDGQIVGFRFTLISEKEGEDELTVTSKRFLQSFGYGINGQKNGSRVMMYFEDGQMGPGWIDSEGQPQSVIYSPVYLSFSAPSGEIVLASGPRGGAQIMGQTMTVLFTPNLSLHERVPDQPIFNVVTGKFEKVTQSVEYEGKSLTVAFYVFSNSRISDYSKRLLRDVGCGIKGNKDGSRVRLALENGGAGVGWLDSAGNLKILSRDGWQEPEWE